MKEKAMKTLSISNSTMISIIFIVFVGLIWQINCSCTSQNTQSISCSGTVYAYTLLSSAPTGCYIENTPLGCSTYADIVYDCPAACALCTDANTCQTCKINAYVNATDMCKLCADGCQNCVDDTYCNYCWADIAYFYSPNVCRFCNLTYGLYCQHCNQIQCLLCNATLGYALSLTQVTTTNACANCNFILYCLTCGNGPVCQVCESAFTKSADGLTCSPTSPIQNCQTYFNNGSCQNCYSPFTKSSDNQTCTANTLIQFCVLYENNGACKTCYNAFTKSADSLVCTITFQILNCQNYQNDGTCKNCYSSFFRASGNLKCNISTAIPFCEYYQNNGDCLYCYGAFSISSDKMACSITTPIKYCLSYYDNGTCQNCQGAFTNTFGVCQPTTPIQYCQHYENDGACKNCYSSFTGSADSLSCTITAPILYCSVYQNNGSCQSCQSSFTKSVDGSICSPKNPIQYCQLYENTGQCHDCYSSFSKSSDSLLCTITSPISNCGSYVNNGKCQECEQTKIMHFGLETDGLGCYNCQSISSKCIQCNGQHKCESCYQPFQVDSLLGNCDQCINGYAFINGHCVNSEGCADQATIRGVKVCLSCFKQYHFDYDDKTNKCVCQLGYKKIIQNQVGKCISVCGNGILAPTDQDCDDGNLLNNDGCDQSCKKQTGFDCTPLSPSKCTLNLKVNNFQSNYAEKLEGQNKCKFSFSINHLFILLLTTIIFCYQGYLSFQEYKYSRLTDRERQKIPKSLIEKLEHDQNNMDKVNYKPGYVLIYLAYYFILELIVGINLFTSQKQIAMYIMLAVSFIYFIVICFWRPYYQPLSFHNKIIIYNHGVLLLFVLLILILTVGIKSITISTGILVAINYFLIFLLIIVAIMGYIRIYVQYRFRQRFEQNPELLNKHIMVRGKKSKQKQKKKDQRQILKQSLTKRQLLMFENSFVFNQFNYKVEYKPQNQKINKKLKSKIKEEPTQSNLEAFQKTIQQRKKLLQKFRLLQLLNVSQKNVKKTNQIQEEQCKQRQVQLQQQSQRQKSKQQLKKLKQKMRMKTDEYQTLKKTQKSKKLYKQERFFQKIQFKDDDGFNINNRKDQSRK